MRRPIAVKAEIARRGHQPGAEVIVPQPIHRHPPDQRIGRVGQPAGQGGTSLLLGRIGCCQIGRESRNDRQRPWRNFVAWRLGIAALQQMRGGGRLRNDGIDFLFARRRGNLTLQLAAPLEQGGPDRRVGRGRGAARGCSGRRVDDQPRIAEKNLIVRDAVAAIGRHQGQKPRLFAQRKIEPRAPRGMVDSAPFGPRRAVDVYGKVGAGPGAQATVSGHGLKMDRLELRQRLPDRGQIECDGLVGMQGDHRVARRRVIDAIDFGRILRQDLAGLDVIPALAVGGRCFDDDSGRADRRGAIGNDHAVDEWKLRTDELAHF